MLANVTTMTIFTREVQTISMLQNAEGHIAGQIDELRWLFMSVTYPTEPVHLGTKDTTRVAQIGSPEKEHFGSICANGKLIGPKGNVVGQARLDENGTLIIGKPEDQVYVEVPLEDTVHLWEALILGGGTYLAKHYRVVVSA